MLKTPLLLFVFILTTTVLLSCSTPLPVLTDQPGPLPEENTTEAAYPYPPPDNSVSDLSGYPGPITPIPTMDVDNIPPLDIPDPSPGLGIVRGQLKVNNQENRIILIADIFLAPVVYSEGQLSLPFLRLDPAKDPKAALRNPIDEFVVLDVPPGNYGIILHGPVSDYITPDKGSETGFLIVEVKPDQTIDLGIIIVDQ